MVAVSSSKTQTVPNWCKNSVPNLTPALVGRWRSKLHRRDQRVPCEAWQPRRPLRDVSSCRRFFLPPLGPLAVPSSSFFWTTHLVLGTRRRRRFKPPPTCFGHSFVVVVERHVPALANAPGMIILTNRADSHHRCISCLHVVAAVGRSKPVLQHILSS